MTMPPTATLQHLGFIVAGDAPRPKVWHLKILSASGRLERSNPSLAALWAAKAATGSRRRGSIVSFAGWGWAAGLPQGFGAPGKRGGWRRRPRSSLVLDLTARVLGPATRPAARFRDETPRWGVPTAFHQPLTESSPPSGSPRRAAPRLCTPPGFSEPLLLLSHRRARYAVYAYRPCLCTRTYMHACMYARTHLSLSLSLFLSLSLYLHMYILMNTCIAMLHTYTCVYILYHYTHLQGLAPPDIYVSACATVLYARRMTYVHRSRCCTSVAYEGKTSVHEEVSRSAPEACAYMHACSPATLAHFTPTCLNTSCCDFHINNFSLSIPILTSR